MEDSCKGDAVQRRFEIIKMILQENFLLICDTYSISPLREVKDLKNDGDLVNYYQRVMKIGEDSEKLIP